MSTMFLCPHCGAVLNPEHAIILKASLGHDQVLIGMHPDPGNYQIYVGHSVPVRAGTAWTFSCPMCHEDLQAEGAGNENLCTVTMQTDQSELKVFFSRIAGEKATWVVNRQGEVEQHGDAATQYADLQMKYLV